MHVFRTILLIIISFFVIESQSVFSETKTYTEMVKELGLYAPTEQYFERSWKLPDIDKVRNVYYETKNPQRSRKRFGRF